LFKDFHGPAGVGIATTTDALAALRTCVYEERRFELSDLVAALDRDFDGDEVLRQTLVNGAPKYGNGDEATDKLAARIAKHFCQTVLSHRTVTGGRFVPLLAANTSNIPAGREVGATPDGRHAFTPLSDAASPHFGRDTKGPTQVIRSLARVDYSDVVGGSVVNMRFERSALAGERGTKNLAALIRAYFDMGGGQMQFNVTNRKTLETAREKPEEHRNLLVRVSGFSAVYVGLPDEVQRDILARTEQTFG
jgi:formate C-acetyltransferase